jgi:nucleotide-binding universal stress UspA family protein
LRSDNDQIFNDIQRFAGHFDMRVDAQVAVGSRPENAVLALAERGRFDLLVLGVTPRPSERRLHFGPRAEYILRNARCATAIVVSPLTVRHS